MKKSLIALAVVTFALGITEFGMMGILGDVARGLDVNIVKAGHFISAYSAGVAVGAPMLILLHKMPLRKLLLLLVATIAIGNAAAAFSTNYIMLLISRFVSGLPHGAFFGAGAIVCARLAAPRQGAAAVAVMVGGMTVANLVGVPLATFISNLLNWRFSFVLIAACALAGLLLIRLWLPRLEPLPDTGFNGQFKFLRHLAPWLIYIGVFFGQGSVYCFLSYIDPVMTNDAGFRTADMSWIMMVAGLGMVVGNALAGKLADRFGAARVCAWIAACLIVVMPSIYFTASIKWAVLPFTFVATAGLFGIGGPLQYLIVGYAKGGEMLGGAGIQIAFNVSNAVSAVVGGLVINHGFGYASPALLGAPFAMISAIALFWLTGLASKEKTTPGVSR